MATFAHSRWLAPGSVRAPQQTQATERGRAQEARCPLPAGHRSYVEHVRTYISILVVVPPGGTSIQVACLSAVGVLLIVAPLCLCACVSFPTKKRIRGTAKDGSAWVRKQDLALRYAVRC